MLLVKDFMKMFSVERVLHIHSSVSNKGRADQSRKRSVNTFISVNKSMVSVFFSYLLANCIFKICHKMLWQWLSDGKK